MSPLTRSEAANGKSACNEAGGTGTGGVILPMMVEVSFVFFTDSRSDRSAVAAVPFACLLSILLTP